MINKTCQYCRPKRLPGDPTKKAAIDRMIRVNHAGEYGAVRIYQGQLAVLNKSNKANIIEHMLEQEKHHLSTFEQLVVERRVRPTLLTPLWHLAGFVLGAGTALLGEKAAMACTVAVEEVIEEHYAEQIASLKEVESETELQKTFKKFRQDEIEHRDTALKHDAKQIPDYGLITHFIKNGSRLAIWMSKRL